MLRKIEHLPRQLHDRTLKFEAKEHSGNSRDCQSAPDSQFIDVERLVCEEKTDLLFIRRQDELLFPVPPRQAGTLRREFADNVRNRLDKFCPLLYQTVGTAACTECYIAGNSEDFPALLQGKTRSYEGTAFLCSLNYKHPS